MEVKQTPGHRRNPDQTDTTTNAFNYFASHSEGARLRKHEGKPPVIFGDDVPKLLRGCGRALTKTRGPIGSQHLARGPIGLQHLS